MSELVRKVQVPAYMLAYDLKIGWNEISFLRNFAIVLEVRVYIRFSYCAAVFAALNCDVDHVHGTVVLGGKFNAIQRYDVVVAASDAWNVI